MFAHPGMAPETECTGGPARSLGVNVIVDGDEDWRGLWDVNLDVGLAIRKFEVRADVGHH